MYRSSIEVSQSPQINNVRMSQLKDDMERSQKQKKSIMQRAFGLGRSKLDINYREGYYGRVFETNPIQLRYNPTIQQNIDIFKHLLFMYYEDDMIGTKKTFLQFSKPRLCEFQSLSEIDPDLIYYLTIASTREIYESYSDWLSQFVNKESLLIDNHAFNNLINYVASKDLLGSTKFSFFENIIGVAELDAFGGGAKSQSANVNLATERFLFNKMCETNDQVRFKTDYVNYWKFLPFVMSFYFYSLKKSIHEKKNKFDLCKGIEVMDGQEIEIKNIFSLTSIIRSMGIKYLTDKLKKNLSYRDIEKILMKYKNMNNWMTYEHIKEIMKVFERKMRVDSRTKIEAKRLQLHKLIDILALKICTHDDVTQAKHQGADHQKITLIVQLWHSAYYSRSFSKSGFYLKQTFKTFFDKRHPNTSEMNSYEWNLTLNEFLKKLFPLMSKQSVSSIMGRYSDQREELLGFNEVRDQLFIKLCEFGELKIFEIFDRTFKFQGLSLRTQKLIERNDSIPSQMALQSHQDKSESDEEAQGEAPPVFTKFQTASYYYQNSPKTQTEQIDQKQPDVLKSTFIMENFLHKYMHKSMRMKAEKVIEPPPPVLDARLTLKSIRTSMIFANTLMNDSQGVISKQGTMNMSPEIKSGFAKANQKSQVFGSDFEDDEQEEQIEHNRRHQLLHKMGNASLLSHSTKKQHISVENGEYHKYMHFDKELIEEMKELEEKKSRNRCCLIF